MRTEDTATEPGTGGPPLSSSSAPSSSDTVVTDETNEVWPRTHTPTTTALPLTVLQLDQMARKILSNAGDLSPTPEQSARIWERLVTRLGWRR